MKILVCLSNVPDTTTKVKFVNDNSQFDTENVQWVINPWDELALTRALELKEDSGNNISQVHTITVGESYCDPTIRKALAIGADKSFRIDSVASDAYFVASQIADFLKKEKYDIVICGIESSDYNGSGVGAMISEMIDCPSISSVTDISFQADELRVARAIPGGIQILKTELPFVAIVQKGITNEARIPAMRGIMMARKKPLEVLSAIEIPMLTKQIRFELPRPKASCKMIAADQVEELIDLLHHEAKIL